MYILGTALMGGVVVFLTKILPIGMLYTLIEVAAGMAVYAAVLLLSREELVMKVLNAFKRSRGEAHA